MTSIWQETTENTQSPSLTNDVSTNTVIIGGGLTGTLLSYLLTEEGIENIVLEAKTRGSGKTGNSTAKLTLQHGLTYAKFMRTMGFEKAKLYAEANEKAIKRYLHIIEKANINCALEEKPAYLYSTNDETCLQQEYDAAKLIGIDCTLTQQTSLPFAVSSALRFEKQYQFHPLKFLMETSKELTIYENTPVESIRENKVITRDAVITAKNIVYASHYPYNDKAGLFFSRLHQERSYVLALKNAQAVDGMYLGVHGKKFSLRNYGDTLLLGGGNHRTGENQSGHKYDNLDKAAKQWWPKAEIVDHWSAQDNMSLDGMPYIGKYTPFSQHCYVATGYGKWGMTSSMVAASLICDAITGKNSKYSRLFSPQRFTLAASYRNFFSNAAHSATDLLRYPLTTAPYNLAKLPPDSGSIMKIDGKKIGVYRDQDRQLHYVTARCPHMGCELTWNPDERSWDCPCHGSRFTYKGDIIDNPSHKSIKL